MINKELMERHLWKYLMHGVTKKEFRDSLKELIGMKFDLAGFMMEAQKLVERQVRDFIEKCEHRGRRRKDERR